MLRKIQQSGKISHGLEKSVLLKHPCHEEHFTDSKRFIKISVTLFPELEKQNPKICVAPQN